MSDISSKEVLELARKRLEERREAELQERTQALDSRSQRERPWRYAFFGAMGVFLVALLFTPGLPLEFKMYAVVHGVCAQEHNVFLGGLQFPLCARNSGIYISFLLTLFYLWGIGRSKAGRIPPWPITVLLGLFIVIMGIDGTNSLLLDLGLPNLYPPQNLLRTLTGLGMGISIGVLLHLIFNLALRRDVDDQQPVFANWREFGGIILLDLVVLVAIYGNLDIMFWPLAFIAFFGITGVLFMVNLLLISLFMGYDGAVTHPLQLVRPATIALIPTLLMLGVFSYLRFALEAQGLLL